MAKKTKKEESSTEGSSGVFPKKYLKNLPAEFQDNVGSMDEKEIKAKMVEYARTQAAVEIQMQADPEVQQLKDSLKLAQADYVEEIARLTAQVKYLCWTLEERGISNKSSDDKED